MHLIIISEGKKCVIYKNMIGPGRNQFEIFLIPKLLGFLTFNNDVSNIPICLKTYFTIW